jgi:hypothetical protein
VPIFIGRGAPLSCIFGVIQPRRRGWLPENLAPFRDAIDLHVLELWRWLPVRARRACSS